MKFIISILILFTYSMGMSAQTVKIDSLQAVLEKEIDTEDRLRTTDRLVNELVKIDPAKALPIARENLRKCKNIDNHELHGESMLSMGKVYFRNQMIDSMEYMYQSSLLFYRKHQFHKLEGTALRNLAVVHQIYGELDSTLYYIDLCIQHLKTYPDSLTLGSSYFTQASVYDLKGYYNLSTVAYLKSLRIYQAINDNRYVGYVEQGLGHTFLKISRTEEAMKHSESALALFKKQENVGQVAQVLNNMGILYKRLGQYSKSREAYHEGIEISTQKNLYSNLALIYHNLMDLEYSDGNTSLALRWAQKTDSIALLLGIEHSRGEALRMKTLLAIERNDISNAKKYIEQAEPYQKAYEDPEHTFMAYRDMGKLYSQLGEFDRAYASLELSQVVEDSVFTLERNAQIEELSLIYETEKKDAAIILLEKESELNASQKRALWIGIILTVLLALSIIYSLIQRKKKETAVLTQAREVELKKRQLAEQQLEFKKKELTAKALQLAKKNEFLQELETEVTELQSSVDSSVGKASSRITRMIQRDTVNDEEWDQFSAEFTSVHQGFLDGLRERFGSFSKGEMRLIYLLRMNMSSKEIASLLHISGDGVRKSRYRLRKKMGLDPSEDLQGLILGM